MAERQAGSGWIAFAGIILIIVGVKNVIDGLWALDHKDTAADALLYSDSLTFWGWFYLIVGVMLIAAGIGVFSRVQWARWIGIIGAAIAAVINILWVFVFPVTSLIGTLLAVLVLYALVVYGDEDVQELA